MARRTTASATALPAPRTRLQRPRLVPDPAQPPSYSPEEDGAKVLAAVLERHPKTNRAQWSVTCTWQFGERSIWRAEAWHPSVKIMPYAATGDAADEAMENLLRAVQRGA